jgi:cytochrome c oxidase subunit 2
MVGKRCLGILFGTLLAGLGLAGGALAQQQTPVIGVPHDWQMNFSEPYTPLMAKVESLHDLLLVIITFICVFVLALLLYVMWRFHASRNPTPTTTTHNTVLEVAWTIIPILVLVVIAIPSFRLLYYGDKAQDAAMTVKVTGHQWYWQYEYPDQGNISIDSRILPEADRIKLKPNQPRQLAVVE